MLIRYGTKIVPDQDLVKDCIQDCFYDLYQRSDKLNKVDNVKYYLLGMIRRSLLYELNQRKKTVNLDQAPDRFELSIESSIIEHESRQIDLDKLQMALSKLSPKQREIIYLKFHEQLSLHEIEKITSTNYQSVRNMLSKANKNNTNC